MQFDAKPFKKKSGETGLSVRFIQPGIHTAGYSLSVDEAKRLMDDIASGINLLAQDAVKDQPGNQPGKKRRWMLTGAEHWKTGARRYEERDFTYVNSPRGLSLTNIRLTHRFDAAYIEVGAVIEEQSSKGVRVFPVVGTVETITPHQIELRGLRTGGLSLTETDFKNMKVFVWEEKP